MQQQQQNGQSSGGSSRRKARQISAVLVRNLQLGYNELRLEEPANIASTSDIKGKRRASDPPLFSTESSLHRSRSRTSVNSNESGGTTFANSPSKINIKTRTTRGRAGSTASAASKSSLQVVFEPDQSSNTGNTENSTSRVTFASVRGQTTRQRSATTALFCPAEISEEISTNGRPGRLRRTSSASRILRYAHASNEAHFIEERRATVSRVLKSTATCFCVVSTATKETWRPISITEPHGPLCNFEWELEPGAMRSNCTNIKIDIYAQQSASNGETTLAISWEIELAELVPIGRLRDSFPSFPPNTIILQTDDGEYLTAPFDKKSARPLPMGNTEVDLSQESLAATKLLQTAEQNRAATLEIIARSQKETRMLASETLPDFECITNLAREYSETQIDLIVVQNRTNQQLRSNRDWEVRREKDSQRHNVQLFKDDLASNKDARNRTRTAIEEQRDLLNKRKARLKAARQRLQEQIVNLGRFTEDVGRKATEREQVGFDLASERGRAIDKVDSFYPITLYTPSTERFSLGLTFAINDVYLPNSDFPANLGLLDDSYSSALGMAAHVTSMAAAYLGIALFYPLACAGSRSLVSDPISPMKGPRAFPLYATGVERYRFEYGVLLLNKNIEFIMQSQGLVMMDLKETLPNLKNLLLTISGRGLLQEAKSQRDKESERLETRKMNGHTMPPSPSETIREVRRYSLQQSPTAREKLPSSQVNGKHAIIP